MTNDDIHVQFPPHFVAIKRYPGYFYHLNEKIIYSIKYGVLRPLAVYKPNRWSYQWNIVTPYVKISHEGIRHTIVLSQVQKEIEQRGISNSIIPVKPTAKYYT